MLVVVSTYYTDFIWSQFHRSDCSVLVLVLWVGPVSRRAGRVGEMESRGRSEDAPWLRRWPGGRSHLPVQRRAGHRTCRAANLPPHSRINLQQSAVCVDNSEWWMWTLLTKLTLFGLLSSPFVKIEQEIHWNVTGLVRMRKFWVNSPSQFFLYFSLWDLCTRKFISVKNPYNTEQIDAKIWMLKILYDCIYVLPLSINPKMMDMDNVKLNSSIYNVFIYRIRVLL